MPVTLPCGQCVGCRLERSRQWAIRCVHEASLYEDNCFITLTYNNQYLPPDGSLRVRDFQLFMKRLRRSHGPNIRFYHCGEYGEQYGRPHYHACLFNFDFVDKRPWKQLRENTLYRSAELERLWPYGHSSVGGLTFQSAAYVARYIMKKVNGKAAEDHYEKVDPETGEIHRLTPEYTTMSRRPGIGKGWLEKYSGDVYPGDFVVLNGKKMRPPKFYDVQYELMEPEEMEGIKKRRLKALEKHSENNTRERLRVRETIQYRKLDKLGKSLEE